MKTSLHQDLLGQGQLAVNLLIDGKITHQAVPESRGKEDMGKRFEEKVAIVTGAGQGMGRQVALDLAAEGAKIVACDINYRRYFHCSI